VFLLFYKLNFENFLIQWHHVCTESRQIESNFTLNRIVFFSGESLITRPKLQYTRNVNYIQTVAPICL